MMFELNSYSGIIVVEAGIVDWKDLRPFFMRLLPSTRKRLAAMPAIRKSLQEDLRGKCIKQVHACACHEELKRPGSHY
jgi:hypothetical protein